MVYAVGSLDGSGAYLISDYAVLPLTENMFQCVLWAASFRLNRTMHKSYCPCQIFVSIVAMLSHLSLRDLPSLQAFLIDNGQYLY